MKTLMRFGAALFVAVAFLGRVEAAEPAPAEGAVEDEPIEEIEDVDVAPVSSTAAWYSPAYPVVDRSVNLMHARTTRRGSLVLVVDHRTRQAFATGESAADNLKQTFFDFFGFDAGALKIGLGLRYGILDELDVGVYRLNGTAEIFDVYELDLKYRPLSQEKYAIDLAVRAGVTWFSQPKADDAAGGFGQLLIGRRFFDRLSIGTGLLFHSESSNEFKTNRDDAWSLAVPAWVDIRILSFLAWNVEIYANVAGYGSKYPAFASSVKFITNRHTFSLILSNTQYTSADGIVSNTDRDFDHLVVGFQIVREFSFL